MQALRVEIEIASPITGARRSLAGVPVNADALLSWIPCAVLEALMVARGRQRQFLQRDGSILHRSTGSVIIRVAGVETFDEVVFAEPGDPAVLGARTLDGLNLRIDPLNGGLVDAGPAPAAASL